MQAKLAGGHVRQQGWPRKSARDGTRRSARLHDPRALFQFEDNDVIIPIYVIEEIDQFKRDLSELGRNARQVSRLLDGFRQQGSLTEGVRLVEDGGPELGRP